MDGGLGDKIREILNDPEALAKIAQIASGLSPPQNAAQTFAETPNVQSNPQGGMPLGGMPQVGMPQGGAASAMSALSALSGKTPGNVAGDSRFALLSSLRPLLKEDKRKKIDNMKTALTIANILGNFKKRT